MNEEWLARQFRGRDVSEVVRDSGWIHTAGGTGVDLSLFARLGRADALVRPPDVVEVPAVRDSMMLVHRDDAALARAAGRRAFFDRVRKLDLDMKEIDELAEAIAIKMPISMRELRGQLPSRSLGEQGRKLGLTSTLAVAFRVAQLKGPHIDDLDRELAKRFVEWAAPTNANEFAAWAGIGKRAAAKALEGLTPGNVATRQRGHSNIHFLPYRDNYTYFHALEPTHHHTIVVDGEVRGWFEYDGERLVWRMRDGKRPRDVARAAREVETFIREELGDLRHYAADNEKNRAARVRFVRGESA